MEIQNPTLVHTANGGARIRPADMVAESIITSGTSSVSFTLPAKYRAFLLRIRDLVVATDDAELQLRVSHDGGSTFDSAASSYSWTAERITSAGSTAEGSTTDTRIPLCSPTANVGIGNASTEGLCCDVRIHNPRQSSVAFQVSWQSGYLDPSTRLTSWHGGGRNLNAFHVDAIELTASSGNINNARITLYGLEGL